MLDEKKIVSLQKTQKNKLDYLNKNFYQDKKHFVGYGYNIGKLNLHLDKID